MCLVLCCFTAYILHFTSCMCNTTLCLTYFLFGYEISLFGGLWCLHFHFVPFLSLLYSVLYALIIRTKSRRACTSLHTMLFIKHFPGVDCRILYSIIYIVNSQYLTTCIHWSWFQWIGLLYRLTSKYLWVKNTY